jgi:hypothetical protein
VGLSFLRISFLVLIACEKTDPEPDAKIFDVQSEYGFVGVVGESEGIVYACSGDEEISEWFNGDINNPACRLCRIYRVKSLIS